MSMPSLRSALLCLVACTLGVIPSFASRTHRAPTSGHWRVAPGKKPKSASKIHGQRQIDSTRAAQIQEALIKQNYLTGDATGQWDQQTSAAMQKFQADHGWQTKLMPDSRALIKLGLGPNPVAGTDHPGSQTMLSEPRSGFNGGNSLADSYRVSQ